MLSRETPRRSGCEQLIIHLFSLGIIIAPLLILQACGNNVAWCQVIGGNYIEAVCSDKVECKNVVVKLAGRRSHTLQLKWCCFNLDSSSIRISNITLIKWCILQKAYSVYLRTIFKFKNINKFNLTHGVGDGKENHDGFFPLLSNTCSPGKNSNH